MSTAREEAEDRHFDLHGESSSDEVPEAIEWFIDGARWAVRATDETVEAVARVLFVKDVPGIFTEDDWGGLSEAARDDLERIARAVLMHLVERVQ